MFMDQMGERGTRDRALEDSIQQAVKARPRRYDPVKTGWLASCIVALGAFRLIVWNIQAVWASPAMAVPKKDTLRLVKLPWLMMTCFVCVSGIVMFCGFRLGIRLFKFD